MSKPPKTDFKALIAGQIAPAVNPETLPLASVEATTPPVTPGEVAALKQRRTLPVQKPAGTLKQRAHQLSVYLEAPVYDALRDIAHAERTKLHPLILEGIDMVLKKRGSPSIKQLIEKAG
jgi:hypothetical protein